MNKNNAVNREYLKTHEWITFDLDLKRASWEFWVHLGATVSKIRHVASTLLPPDKAEDFYKLWLIRGAQATTAIEGNTLSEEQVREVMEGESQIPPSMEYQEREVENIIKACEEISNQLLDHQTDCEFNVELIKKFNRQVLKDLPLDDYVIPGEVPTTNIVVGNVYKGAPRQDCEYLMDRMCKWIEKNLENDGDYRMHLAIIQAIVAHVYFVWIHPFGDGNGRTARLIELFILGRAGVPIPCAHLLSNHYNKTRPQYGRALKNASGMKNGILEFLNYAIRGFRDGLAEQIDKINNYQWAATWKEHVFETFDNSGRRHNEALKRQRQIALDLWEHGVSGINPSEVKDVSTAVKVYYAKLSRANPHQDIAQLRDMKLVELTKENKIRVAFSRIVADQFMPRRLLD